MAFSKTFLLLGLAFAVVLLISAEVSARELAETTTQETNLDHGHGYHHHHHGHHHHHHHHHGKHHGGPPADETKEVETEAGGN